MRPILTLSLTMTFLLASCGTESSPHLPSTPVAAADPDAPLSILQDWDARRAAAYASGSADELSRLYITGSEAGPEDVALLQRYVERDLTVIGMQTQVLSLDVIEQSAQRLRLAVTDRLTGARSRGAQGETPLPQDQASTHEVVLRRVEGQWLVESVT